MYYSVRSFFENGGAACYIVRVVDVSATEGAAPTVVAANALIDAADAADMLKVSAGYRGKFSFGAKGKDLSVKFALNSGFSASAVSADAAIGDTSIKVTSSNGLIGDIIKVESDENADANLDQTLYLKVAGTRTVVESGLIVRYVDLAAPLASAITAANSVVSLLAYDLEVIEDGEVLEAFSRLTMNPDSDQYFETVINDEQVGSRYILVEDLNNGTLLSNARELGATLTYPLDNDGQDELAGVTVADDIIAAALPSLEAKRAVNLLSVPPSLNNNGIIAVADIPVLHAGMLEFCGYRMDMFAILDAPRDLADADAAGSIGEYRKNTLGVDTFWGAALFPQIRVPLKQGSTQLLDIPPSGAIAGLYSRVDAIPAPRGGISTAPAGHGDFGQLRGVSGTSLEVSDAKHGDLNVIGVNCIRVVDRASGSLPGALVLGARTLSSTLDFRYINVRRMMTFIEKNVKFIGEQRLFRNNGPQLWSELTNEITSFLTKRYNLGELAGNDVSQAFFVKIDSETNTAENIRQGILVDENRCSASSPCGVSSSASAQRFKLTKEL